MSEEKKDDVAQDPQRATANSNIDGTKAADAAADEGAGPDQPAAEIVGETVKADAATEPSAADADNLPAAPGTTPTPWWSVSDTGCSAPSDAGDTSGYGGLVTKVLFPAAVRPYGSYFDEIADTLERGLVGGDASFSEAVERVVVDRGELTLFVRREHLRAVARVLRDDPGLRFEICTGVSGVHYRRDRPRAPRSTTCCRSPTVADVSASRSPAPTATPTSRPSSRSTRPTTGTSARRGTCSGSSSTATRP